MTLMNHGGVDDAVAMKGNVLSVGESDWVSSPGLGRNVPLEYPVVHPDARPLGDRPRRRG